MCGEVLKAIIDKVGAEHFPAPVRLDDAAWVGYRLAEVLPLELAEKQELLEISDTGGAVPAPAASAGAARPQRVGVG